MYILICVSNNFSILLHSSGVTDMLCHIGWVLPSFERAPLFATADIIKLLHRQFAHRESHNI
jgi:hypothetical protein